MNKIAVGLVIFSCSLSSSMLLAGELLQSKSSGPKIFFGVDYFDGETNLDRDHSTIGNVDFDIDVTGYRIKLGVQAQENLRVQGFFKVEDLDKEIFALSSDGKIYGIGGEGQLMLPINPNFSPYVLGGISADFAELDDPGVEYSEETINGIALKAGVGALLKFNEHIELQLGWNIQYRTWQDIEFDESGSIELEQEDISQTYMVGLNFFF